MFFGRRVQSGRWLVVAALPLMLAADALEPLKPGFWEETRTVIAFSGKSPTGQEPKVGEKNIRKFCIEPGTDIRKYVEIKGGGKQCIPSSASKVDPITKTFRIEMACKNHSFSGGMVTIGSWSADRLEANVEASIAPLEAAEGSRSKAQMKIEAHYLGGCDQDPERWEALPPPTAKSTKKIKKRR